jgi:hypothetical protein
MSKLPHCTQPCKNCPYRKDNIEINLHRNIESYINAESFVCHKNNNLQCAGHMIINGSDNGYVALAESQGIDLGLKGQHLIFDNKQDCIKHHKLTDNELD